MDPCSAILSIHIQKYLKQPIFQEASPYLDSTQQEYIHINKTLPRNIFMMKAKSWLKAGKCVFQHKSIQNHHDFSTFSQGLYDMIQACVAFMYNSVLIPFINMWSVFLAEVNCITCWAKCDFYTCAVRGQRSAKMTGFEAGYSSVHSSTRQM